ncbi:glycosyltransferase family 2 protein [Polaribacter sp. 20A6]|uniref:glycosyltransferase family 2 protein n=1 Tax=Polaribacter sp. 20A6 TaxID=2687289 RepID=UPI0013FDFEDC|nr:glycosyltransferase [Polaribacter sp. 20A6]
MHTTVIIVTYGDRFHLLEKVVRSCFLEDVSKIIVIDNNSEEKSKTKLLALSKDYKENIKVIWNEANLGSAKAFKQGLNEANSRKESEYIWLLDDDNKPNKNSLKILKDYWAVKPTNVHALLSYRPDRSQYKQAIEEDNPELVLSWENSFSGFHFFEKISRPFKRKKEKLNIQIGEIAYAPYGGIFFHVSILELIGYPDEDYFLYSDDHDWTYRITNKGMKIHLLLDSVVDDIDTSWAIKDGGSSIFAKIKKAPSLRVYYTIRNRIVFEKKYLISNRLVYSLNRLLFTFFITIYAYNTINYKVFLRAVNDAKNNNLVKF